MWNDEMIFEMRIRKSWKRNVRKYTEMKTERNQL